MAALVVGIVFDGGRKEGVDEGRLSEARLASNLLRLDNEVDHGRHWEWSYHNSESSSTLCDDLVPDQLLDGAAYSPVWYYLWLGSYHRLLAVYCIIPSGCAHIGNANWRCGFGHGGCCCSGQGSCGM